LENSKDKDPNYEQGFTRLRDNLIELSATLNRYKDLVKAAGVDAQDLNFKLTQDYMMKLKALENAKHLLDGKELNEESRRNLIIYFKTCINILKGSLTTIKEFKA
jgi:hypothetical protein